MTKILSGYKGATKIRMRIKEMKVFDSTFDRYMSSPKSNTKDYYLNVREADIKKYGKADKLTLEIVVYYGKNVSEKFTKRI